MKNEKIRNKSTNKNNPNQSCDGVTNCTSFQLLPVVKSLTIRLLVPFPKKCEHFSGALFCASCVWSQKEKKQASNEILKLVFKMNYKRSFFSGATSDKVSEPTASICWSWLYQTKN